MPPEATKEEVEILRHALGLDRPKFVQYLDSLEKIFLHGDFGTSFYVKAPTLELIMERMPATLELTSAGLLFSIIIAIPLGIISAVRRYSMIDNIASIAAVLGQATPLFWLGIMLMIIFGLWLDVLPISGRGGWANLVLPAVTLGAFLAPLNMRLTRSGMIEVMSQEYIRTARAKGLKERKLIFKYPVRISINPIISTVGWMLPQIISGSLIVSVVLSLPTTGNLLLMALRTQDMYLAGSMIMLLSFLTILGTLLSDIMLAVIDPRIRLEK